jgi:hypothetical protein
MAKLNHWRGGWRVLGLKGAAMLVIHFASPGIDYSKM